MKLSVTALALLLMSRAFSQQVDKAKLDQFFSRLIEKNQAMGGIYVARAGNKVYERSIGYSFIEANEKKAITRDTKFRVGSVTKLFTAAMIFQLMDEGKINITDRLDKYFPAIVNANQITIAQLLGHRSGLHDISGDREFRAKRQAGLSREEMLFLLEKSAADFPPGEKYVYNNTGYFLLACLLEKLTGKSYNELLSKRISSTLGLGDTYNAEGAIDASKSESYSYRYGNEWQPQVETNPSLLLGSGSLASTPADMAKFMDGLFNRRIISDRSLQQMTEGHLGLDTFTYNGRVFYGHTGGVDNFGAWLVYDPEEKLSLAYATNAKVYPVGDIIDGVFNILGGKPFSIPTFESFEVNADILDKYVGVYTSSEMPVTFTVTRDGNRLVVQTPNQSVVSLEAVSETKFIVQTPPIEFRFDAAKGEMTIVRNGRERVLTRAR
jgi:CubicO group peptidase (beta-lactamase class C family)